MDINNANLQRLFVAMNAAFRAGLGQATSQYLQIATVVPSTTGSEEYDWLGQLPGLREWIGERAALGAVSPTRMADRIKVPVFLAAGGELRPVAGDRGVEVELTAVGQQQGGQGGHRHRRRARLLRRRGSLVGRRDVQLRRPRGRGPGSSPA